jgi:hypothetical protein
LYQQLIKYNNKSSLTLKDFPLVEISFPLKQDSIVFSHRICWAVF